MQVSYNISKKRKKFRGIIVCTNNNIGSHINNTIKKIIKGVNVARFKSETKIGVFYRSIKRLTQFSKICINRDLRPKSKLVLNTGF